MSWTLSRTSLKLFKVVVSFEGSPSFLGLELPVRIYKMYSERKYLDRLDELIHGSETAKRALREKDEGILIDGQKKRKSTKKDKDSLKKQKK